MRFLTNSLNVLCFGSLEGNCPSVVEIDEDELTLPGDDDITIKSTSATHAVKGVCPRLTNSDKSIGFFVDTF